MSFTPNHVPFFYFDGWLFLPGKKAVAPMKAPMKAGGNKNALNREVGGDGLRDWSYGLLDCFAARRLCNQGQLDMPIACNA